MQELINLSALFNLACFTPNARIWVGLLFFDGLIFFGLFTDNAGAFPSQLLSERSLLLVWRLPDEYHVVPHIFEFLSRVSVTVSAIFWLKLERC